MLESARKLVTVPRVSVEVTLAVGTLVSFAWLLRKDLIHPLVVYLLQLYLAF